VTPLYPQKLALTSPTGGGRSVGIVRVRTKATEFSLEVGFTLVAFVSGIAQAVRRPVYGLDDGENGVRYFACENDFSSFRIVHTAVATHLTLYPDGTTVTFRGVKRSKIEVYHSP